MSCDFCDDRIIDRELKEVGRQTFKNAPFTGWSQSGSHFESHLSRYHGDYIGSDYFYEGKRTFFHLTKIQFLFSILNERSFRFYDLNSSTDPSEYEYAAKILKIKKEEIDALKRNAFIFSFCPESELSNDHVWQNYGDNYRGVAIIFEVVNDPEMWLNFHMSQVQYKVPNAFNDYSIKLYDLQKRRNITARIDLSRLLAFHKQEKFEMEKEIRLLTYNPFYGIDENMKFTKFDYRLEGSRNRFTKFFEFPLWVDNSSKFLKGSAPELDRSSRFNDEYFGDKPKIMIKDIKIGCNAGLDNKEFQDFRSEIETIMFYNFGYPIKISTDFFRPEK